MIFAYDRTGVKVLSIAAAAMYLATAMLCLCAAAEHRGASCSARRFWIVFACAFGLLAAARLLGVEEHARQAIRAMLRSEGEYSQRRLWQVPLAVGFLLTCAGLAIVMAARSRRHAWTIVLARWAGAAMGGLIVLRLISLHAIDRLLYKGPHLNWLIDIGATLAVGVAAWSYRRHLRESGRDRGRRSSKRRPVRGE